VVWGRFITVTSCAHPRSVLVALILPLTRRGAFPTLALLLSILVELSLPLFRRLTTCLCFLLFVGTADLLSIPVLLPLPVLLLLQPYRLLRCLITRQRFLLFLFTLLALSLSLLVELSLPLFRCLATCLRFLLFVGTADPLSLPI
jgi:hypothetical protein